MEATTTGSYNTAVGISALAQNTTGDGNTAYSRRAMYSNTTGARNVAIGYSSLYNNTTADNNTAVGYSALQSVTTGTDNTALGYNAGDAITTGYKNIIIGENASAGAVDANYRIVIGLGTVSAGGNTITLGASGSNRVYNTYTSNATWTRVSDERIKKEITTNTNCGLAFINDLRTVTYKFKAPSELNPSLSEYDADNSTPSHNKKMYGFVAQEVKAAMDTHNITDFEGWSQINDGGDNLQGISYEMFVMPLVKAIQELSAKNEALLTRIEALEG